MAVFAFMNQKGGVGKTTSVVSFGACLAGDHRRRVLLLDLDPQGNLTDHVGIDPVSVEPSIYDVLLEESPPADAVRPVEGVAGLDVLPANVDLAGCELELAQVKNREKRLRNRLTSLAEGYDFILIDCPPSLGLLTLSALAFADGVLVPMQAEYLALRGLSQLVETIEAVREHLNPSLRVAGVLFCMYDARTHLARDVHAEVDRYFAGNVFRTPIRKNVRLAEAPSHGLPITCYDPHCAGAADYRAVVAEFLRRHEAETAPSRRGPVWSDGPETANAEEPAAPPPPPTIAPAPAPPRSDMTD